MLFLQNCSEHDVNSSDVGQTKADMESSTTDTSIALSAKKDSIKWMLRNFNRCESIAPSNCTKQFSDLFGIYLNKGQYGDALSLVLSFEAKNLNDTLDQRKWSLYSKIALYNQMGNFQESLKFNDSLQVLSKHFENEGILIYAMRNRAMLYQKLGNPEKSYRILDSLLYSNERLDDFQKTQLINDLGMYAFYIGNYNMAINHYRTSFELSKGRADRAEFKGLYHANSAEAYIELKDYTAATRHLDSFYSLDQSLIPYPLRKSVFKYELRLAKAEDWGNERTEQLLDKLSKDQQQFYEDRYKKELDALSLEKEKTQKLFIEKQEVIVNRLEQRNRFFLLGGILILLIVGIFFNNYRQRKEHQVDVLLNQQRLLRTQMNPHFIFNTLSSLHHLIETNSGQASKYVLRFSRLLRRVLQNSMNNEVLLSDELSVIKDYLNLQQLRFPHRFKYSLFVDERIETEMVSIPPMLIQPFVENALEHGFGQISHVGHVQIAVKMDHNQPERFITCIITDDGSGLRTHSKKGFKSTSIQLISDFLKKRTGQEVKIINKDPDCGTGVIVELKIPIT